MLTITGHKGNGIKNTLGFHFTPVRMDNIKKTNNDECWEGWGEKETYTLFVGCKLVQPLWKTIWQLLKKNKHRTAI
jgi:hypothetical protein